MEPGGSSNQQQNYNIKAPRSGVVIREPTQNTNAQTNDNNSSNLAQQSFKSDKDQYVPLASVIRIMRQVLPPHAKIADDAKETMQECVSEFISFITSEANHRCHEEYRKTISAEDIISAMRTLGFNDYIEPLTLFLNRHRSQNPNRNHIHHAMFVRRNTGSLNQPQAQLAQPPPPPIGHGSANQGGGECGGEGSSDPIGELK